MLTIEASIEKDTSETHDFTTNYH